MVCSDPPEGFDRWTLELIRDKVIENKIVDSISKEKVRIILKEHDLKPWQQKMWCVPELDEEYIKKIGNSFGFVRKRRFKRKPSYLLG